MKIIWNNFVPLKMNIFIENFSNNILSTNDNLTRRDILDPNSLVRSQYCGVSEKMLIIFLNVVSIEMCGKQLING